ncbi:inositol monophosphatase family protein [Devosia elaeis]|uniref:Inositol-phosphate phosphatase n=1 Tax=Devosia elaeis TaxID=1770058 RepID=A0A178HXN6_9HYPH|nr:inositol monophosphatase family protein [Devosia elaeis]OAM77612.1 hypothetical protein A3840_08865 [Devosia elaeis]
MTIALTNECPNAADLLALAERAARTAGKYLHEHFRGQMVVDRKTRKSDVVTIHDRHAEILIRDIILQAAPDSCIWGEEFGAGGEGDTVWFIDPIDGTSNFAGGMPIYCVSIGIAWRGALVGGVVYDPERDEAFVGSPHGFFVNGQPCAEYAEIDASNAICLTNFPHEGAVSDQELAAYRRVLADFRAVRRFGSAAIALAYVAAGRADVCCELSTYPWDHAAGTALVLASGGTVVARNTSGLPEADVSKFACYVAHGKGFDLVGSVLAELIDNVPDRSVINA